MSLGSSALLWNWQLSIGSSCT